jgi:lysozyme
MHTSKKGIDLIEHFEGFSATYYVDIAGVGTIGFGHTGRWATPGRHLTLSEARSLLCEELVNYEEDINRLVEVPLRQFQFDALSAWHFNTGALAKSTLLKVLNRFSYELVDDQLLRWNKYRDQISLELKVSNGLTRRRMCEALVWNDIPLPHSMLTGVDFRASGMIPSNPDVSWFRKMLAAV